MANEEFFLCQHCMMGGNGREPREELNPLSDIAFAMPENEVFEKIRSTVARVDRDLARQIANDDRFKCITMEDLEKHLTVPAGARVRKGELQLSWQWLRDRARSLGLDTSKIETQTGNVYSDTLEFRTRKGADGRQIPDYIRDKYNSPICWELRCRRCGRLLPRDTGRAPEVRILLQGNARAGKTSLIVSTLWWLYLMSKNKTKSCIDFSLPQEDEYDSKGGFAALNEYHLWFRKELEEYIRGRKVEKTPTEQNEPGSISLYVKIGDQELVLTFLDMPGEFFEKREGRKDLLMRQYTGIYAHVDAIWTCLQYEIMVDKDWSDELDTIKYQTSLDSGNLDLDREKYKARLKEIHDAMEPYDIEEKPHAVILTKTDSLEGRVGNLKSVFDRDLRKPFRNLVDGYACCRNREGERFPLLRENDFHNISSRVARFCEEAVLEGGENVLEELKGFSGETAYFAMSAYGRSVLEKGSRDEQEPEPYHVQLPLLWTLAVLDKLRITYDIEVGSGFQKRIEHDAVFLTEADEECRRNLTKDDRYYHPHRSKKGAR